MTEIRTGRLRLRRARAEDAEALHAVLGDPRAMRYWSTPPHARIEETREWLERMMASPPEISDDFVVEHEGLPIGKAGCWRLPEIGFILRPDHWGRGLAREALEAAIGHVFAAHPLPAIEADVDPRNQASLALLGRLGFSEVRRAKRTWKVGDEWCDSVYLALPRPSSGGQG